MPSRHWQLTPLTKRTVTALAWAGAGMATLTAIAALLELLLFLGDSLELIDVLDLAALSGMMSEIAYYVLTAICGLLIPWCHDVLLAGRGTVETRIMSWISHITALLLLFTITYTLIGGHPPTAARLLLQPLCAGAILVVLLINIPNTAAAKLTTRLQILLLPTLLLAAYITTAPSLLLWNDLIKIGIGYWGFLIMQSIAQTAPYIATMPPRL